MSAISKTSTGFLLLTIAAVIWGVDNTVIKVGIREIPPITFTFLRYIIVSGLFALTLLSSKYSKVIRKKDLPKIAFLAFLNSVFGVALINLSLKHTTASNVSIIISIFPPIFIALLAWQFLKEKLSLTNILGIIIAGLGVGFLMDIFTGLKDLIQGRYFFGNVLILVAALGWAVYNVYGKTIFKKYNLITITAHIFFFGTMSLIPFVFWELSGTKVSLSPASFLPILYDSTLAGFTAYICWNKGLQNHSCFKSRNFQLYNCSQRCDRGYCLPKRTFVSQFYFR